MSKSSSDEGGWAQLIGNERLFMGDGGSMTTWTFRHGYKAGKANTFLEFVNDPEKVAFFRGYYKTYAKIALRWNYGFLLETLLTWKVSEPLARDTLGLGRQEWKVLMGQAIGLMDSIRQAFFRALFWQEQTTTRLKFEFGHFQT